MPTKEELHFVLESELEFGMRNNIPLKKPDTRDRKGKTCGKYVKGNTPGSIKLITKK